MTFLVLLILFKVMLTKNLDVARGLVNGARGVVVAFESGKHGQFIYLFNYLETHFGNICSEKPEYIENRIDLVVNTSIL